MEAQTLLDTIPGEYYLSGVMETASGFKLDSNHHFQFFFSQGALDRYGEGTWRLDGGLVILNSRPRPEHDFALLESRKQEGAPVEIRMMEQDPLAKQYVHARILHKGVAVEGSADKDGRIIFPSQPIDTIELIFDFCPEKTSVFHIASPEHNYFEIRFEPWVMELFFVNFSLQHRMEGLYGRNPVLPGEDFSYRKH